MRMFVLSFVIIAGAASVAWSQSAQTAGQPATFNPKNFTGKVTPHVINDLRMTRYTFDPGARTNWHSHEGGQVIIIEQGRMRAQERGGVVRRSSVRARRIVVAPGTTHWHGALPGGPLTQVALSLRRDDMDGDRSPTRSTRRGAQVACMRRSLLTLRARRYPGRGVRRRHRLRRGGLQARCAACHDNADGRTPRASVLQAMTPTRILRTLDFGAMMTIAYTLRRDEREAVATFLGKPGAEPRPRPEAFCARSHRSRSTTCQRRSWNGWSPSRDNARFVPGRARRARPPNRCRS